MSAVGLREGEPEGERRTDNQNVPWHNGFCRFTNVGEVDCCDYGIRIRYHQGWRREAKLDTVHIPLMHIPFRKISIQ